MQFTLDTVQHSIRGRYRKLIANEEDRKIVTEPYGGEGGGGHVKFIMTQPKSMSSDPNFRPWHLNYLHPVGKKKITM